MQQQECEICFLHKCYEMKTKSRQLFIFAQYFLTISIIRRLMHLIAVAFLIIVFVDCHKGQQKLLLKMPLQSSA